MALINMGLTAHLINGDFHGFTVNRQAFVVCNTLHATVAKPDRVAPVRADKHVPEDGFTGYQKAAFHVTATKTLPTLSGASLGPIPYGVLRRSIPHNTAASREGRR